MGKTRPPVSDSGLPRASRAAGQSPQARLMKALVNFDKPLVAAVHGAVIGGGTTMVTHCDFVYAGESAKFQLPFLNLGVVPEFGSNYSIPAWAGHIRASELFLLGLPFGATRAAELGILTRVVADHDVLVTAAETARQLAEEEFTLDLKVFIFHKQNLPGRGLEPLRIAPPDPKSGASANFATLASETCSN